MKKQMPVKNIDKPMENRYIIGNLHTFSFSRTQTFQGGSRINNFQPNTNLFLLNSNRILHWFTLFNMAFPPLKKHTFCAEYLLNLEGC